MRMPDEDITFTDLVRGPITFKAGTVPDYVVVRAGGDPLYTLRQPRGRRRSWASPTCCAARTCCSSTPASDCALPRPHRHRP